MKIELILEITIASLIGLRYTLELILKIIKKAKEHHAIKASEKAKKELADAEERAVKNAAWKAYQAKKANNTLDKEIKTCLPNLTRNI